ncbi:TetR/AcrR family transcriptional regulator [Nakamurella antarctica]|uniref:TetR/AcrR family transcriptional regulator n=1 Tax=Nakamurella antarctica TaxID=1902245 RepID=A0A3G8ZIE7_9ACTN|nr:TetR/AcrR family transcriptional regulator [Nakamurella antarctica]AZI57172.1 TetR/AcrR family transcriptional regulator [Nakamurella antarctica]
MAIDAPHPSPPARVTKRRGETRARLIASAATIFAEHGFGRATVEDVCEHAGYTRGAFYSNFVSLDELFFALYVERAEQLVQAAGSAVSNAVAELGTDPPISTVVDRVLSTLTVSRQSHLLNLEFFAHALRNPPVALALAAHRRDLRSALAPILRVGLGVRRVSAPQLEALGRAIVAVQDGMYFQELLEPADQRLPRARTTLITRILADAAEQLRA